MTDEDLAIDILPNTQDPLFRTAPGIGRKRLDMPYPLPELRLEEPLEEDIGTLSPYLTLQSASSRTSCNTLSSAGTHSPFDDSTPSTSKFNGSLDLLTINPISKPYLSNGYPASPSSPALAGGIEPTIQLSRSQTLPRVTTAERKHRERQNELDDLVLEPGLIAKTRRWILGIAIVEFDLDDGPVVDGVYPPLILLPSEAENIAFCSFPDSLQFDQGSQGHSFRIREQAKEFSNDKRPQTEDGFIYGFAHFTQRRDSNSKRGYQQCSLVILTQYQYPALFSSLVSILGPLFQLHGTPMLEAACHNIATWRDPTPGETMELGFLGSVLHVEVPHSLDTQQLTETSSFNEKYDPKIHILATSTPFFPPPLLLFEACLPNLWSIWECLVLCEPILVFGASPAQTSQAVWWLRDLLRPIPLAGDFRPYFTMQDGDHSLLVNKLPPKAGLVLGVTNPFFEKSCLHWSHILSLGKRVPSIQRSPTLGAHAGPTPGWKTKTHRRYISKDRVLLKQLQLACRGNDRTRLEASLNLRRHFCSRTTQLVTPLARYLNSLIPTPTEVKRARARSLTHTLRLKPFNNANFLASLKAHGSPLPFKSTSKRTEFYERWLRSPAFGSWLAQQEHIVQTVLNDSAPSTGGSSIN